MGDRMLVAVDGSENALRAVQHAIRLAKQRGNVGLHLVTAYDQPVIYGEIAAYVTPERLAELQRKSAEAALRGAEKLVGESGVDYECEVLTGPIAAVVAKRADELGCDSIVIGTRGMSAIGNLLLGSVSTKIVHFANVPVTLVK